jgi:hypothetical protein
MTLWKATTNHLIRKLEDLIIVAMILTFEILKDILFDNINKNKKKNGDRGDSHMIIIIVMIILAVIIVILRMCSC